MTRDAWAVRDRNGCLYGFDDKTGALAAAETWNRLHPKEAPHTLILIKGPLPTLEKGTQP